MISKCSDSFFQLRVFLGLMAFNIALDLLNRYASYHILKSFTILSASTSNIAMIFLMKQVSLATIDKTIDWLESLESEEEMEQLIDSFGDKQPLLLAFLMSMGEDDLNEEERELLLYIGMFFWKSMIEGGENPEEVTEARLDELKVTNLGLLEAAESGKGKDFDRVWLEETENYGQPELLAFLIETLEEEESFSLRSNNLRALQSYAKIALDSLC